ncbi:hypothetical protein LOTGIDRAFT_128503 [Lottia gigantea]|uniref:Selenoprotein O n=1 Tax=Lottia gigantea TaxID=225164 RepID=V4A0K9_LOTGI|nr:hypothetical protein LOTGIDRAFT_128503 [Lottia gigantea]ESO86801.1 hypothetical protein LOTGIDRAFT_128503 [Lottia gigantea]
MATLETLNFDNLALRSLPIDPSDENRPRQVAGACFSKVKPMPVENPKLVAVSSTAMGILDLPESEFERKEFAEYFSGNKLLPGCDPAAHCYCGHQFGYFSGQLGDGATMYLGEVVNQKKERWEIQFKGAGLTPYSRSADGRKVLRSSIREFLCSEAIHHLGIPTTRAGTCVTSDSRVVRDIFYDGHPIQERCTIILRIAPTFLRFGSFEIFKPVDSQTGRGGPSIGRKDILIQMLDYTVQTFYPQIWEEFSDDKMKMYIEMYKEIIKLTARLVADWQAVGWCHGVLNTDNMSIVGLTIDYGPYGFMDRYDPNFICNGSDDGGRYSYKNQPEICKWNCMKLGEAIQEAVPVDQTKPFLSLFDEEFSKCYKDKMRKKLGLLNKDLPEDQELVEALFSTMEETGSDFTNTFRCLSSLPLPQCEDYESKKAEILSYLVSQSCTIEELRKANRSTMDPRQMQMLMMLMQTNPDLLSILGRRFEAFEKELEKMEKLNELKDVTQEQKTSKDRELWEKWIKKYSDRLKLEAEGQDDILLTNQNRVKIMNQNNPRIILRNYIAQNAIDAAEKGDYSEIRRVLKLLETPYSGELDIREPSSSSNSCDINQSYDSKPPISALDLRVT